MIFDFMEMCLYVGSTYVFLFFSLFIDSAVIVVQ